MAAALVPPLVTVSPALIPVSPGCAIDAAPNCATVTHQTLTLTYELGAPMQMGGGIAVSLGDVFGGHYLRRQRFRWGDLQALHPARPQLVTATTSRPGVRVASMVVATADRGTEAVLLVNGLLLAGDRIEVVLGDTTTGGPGMAVPGMPIRTRVIVRENLQGPAAEFVYLDVRYGMTFPAVETHGGAADGFRLTLPSEARVGEPVRLTVRALAGVPGITSNAFIVRDHDGPLALVSTDPETTLPKAALFTPADRGVLRLPVVFRTPGLHKIMASDQAASTGRLVGALSGASNPVRVSSAATNDRTFWGQLHVHTGRSRDGQGEVEAAFMSARDDAGLDFFAVSEHCNTEDYDHDALLDLVDTFDDPGHFTAFPAYEWSSVVEGHRHVVFAGDRHETAPCEQIVAGTTGLVEAATVADLDRLAAARGAITILHHTLWRGRTKLPISSFTLGEHLRAQKLFEIYSGHGRSEHFDNDPYVIHGTPEEQQPPSVLASFQDALWLGMRLGVVAGSDNHLALADAAAGSNFGTRRQIYSRQGLTAVLAASNSRAALFSALQQRRTYGTTGARIRLRFTAAGLPMGSVLHRLHKHADLRVEVAGTDLIRRIVVIRDGVETALDWQPASPSRSVCLEIQEPVVAAPTSYYARVEQVDDEMAWSSPIWYAPPRGTRSGVRPTRRGRARPLLVRSCADGPGGRRDRRE